VAKVIASSLRRGNVVEMPDGRLYAVLKAENFHPGKGTPVTNVEMRRISDGTKTTERFKTTEGVERAFVEQVAHSYLYEDGDTLIFMNGVNYEQVAVPKDVIGDAAIYLAENMEVQISLYNSVPIAVEIPTRVVLEIVETDAVTKGQTASSSYKPATLTNGLRTMVPPYITAGTKIVVLTDDGSYVERAKD
jgi:elongation factor P